jgi:4-amino-4-deoxy-L-arabinose transferase-like glycosyltransferase
VTPRESPAVEPMPTSGPARSNRAYPWTLAVFAVALITRLLWIDVPLNVDEGLWMRRGPAFLQAVLQGNAPATYQRHHPGVTNMWIIGSAVASRYLLRDAVPAGDLARQTAPELEQDFANLSDYLATVAKLPAVPLELFVSARILAALVTAACMAGLYALSRRLFGPLVAAIAAVILIFEPFYLGYQRFLTTDANQTNFTWLALLAFLIYLRAAGGGRTGATSADQHRWWGWPLLSGVCFGLAVLSKVSAVISLPAFGLAFLWWIFASRTGAARLRLLGGLLVWALAAIAVAMLLWPALRIDPLGTVALMFEEVGEEVAGHTQFFLGRSVVSPSLAFYPIVLLYRLSPLLLFGSILGLISLLSRSLRRLLQDPASLTVILMDLVIVLIGVSSVSSKLDRYIMPLVPGFALLAASGVSALVLRLDETRGAQEPSPIYRRRPAMALIVVLGLQLAVLLPHVPYYVTYFNPLAGGPAVAQKLLMVGNGELMDKAGAWLRRQVPGGNSVVGTWYADSFSPYYGGPTIPLNMSSEFMPETWRLANFVILYINNAQRNFPDQLVEYFSPQHPVFEAKAHGVSYVRVYPGPSVGDAGLPKTANAVSLNFEDHARLAGYELETPEVPAGQAGVLALYWEPLQAFPERDFTVHVGIRDAEGNSWGGNDGVPVGGMLPVDQWQPGQLLRDVQQVTIPPGTPPGEYDVEVSFWSPTLQRGLEIRDGDASLGRRATLTKIKVTLPSGPPDLSGADLGIANRSENEVRVASEGARLLGYEGSPPARARAGDAVPLVLLWQAGTHEPTDVQLHLRLSQGERHWQRAAGHPLGGGYAPSNWTPGQLIRDTWSALLPADAPTGRYQVELVAQGPESDQVLLNLGSIELQTRPHSFDKPHPQFTQEIDLRSPTLLAGRSPASPAEEDVARLLGYDLPAEVRQGQELQLSLYWEALGEPDRNYVRFVHVLDAENRIVAQQDGVPGNGEAPLTSWLAGETLQDNLAIAVPAGLPQGRYRLAVGMYDPASGRRLNTHDNEEQILLSQEIEVR